MSKTWVVLLLAVLIWPCFAVEEKTPRLVFPANGFSIAPLDGKAGAGSFTALMMFLPVTDGFGPNVNVMIQPYPGTLQTYADLSRQQFAAAKMTLVSEQLADGMLTLEYTGTLQNNAMHFYSRAFSADGKVYLATATAREAQWETSGAKLKSCVDSLRKE